MTLGFSYQERPNLYYPLWERKTDVYYPPNPDRVWVYATEERLKPGQRVQAKTMEEFIAAGQILFPVEQRVEVWESREELLAAIERGDVPKTGKALMLRPDLPDLDFWIGRKVGFGRPAFKRYKADLRNLNQPVSSWVVPTSEQKKYEAENSFVSGTNQEGAKAVAAIFGTKSFNYAKPPSLIKELVRQSSGENGLVFDFFAGSGTTAQAVLELNREDGGGRRFIMVSATEATSDEPDKNICRDVCAERIRRVIAGYGGKEGTGGDFAYLRARRIPQEEVLLEIDHAEVWTAVQLIHRQSFSPFSPEATLQESLNPASGLVYVTTLGDDTINSIVDLAGLTAHLTVYSWQPGLLRERLPVEGITVEQIPQFLVNRFGGFLPLP